MTTLLRRISEKASSVTQAITGGKRKTKRSAAAAATTTATTAAAATVSSKRRETTASSSSSSSLTHEFPAHADEDLDFLHGEEEDDGGDYDEENDSEFIGGDEGEGGGRLGGGNHKASNKKNKSSTAAVKPSKPSKLGRKFTQEKPANKRIEQNRAAQRAHRERKEKYLTDLEQRVKDFEKAAALNANTDEQMRLIQENRELKELVVSLESELKTAKFDFEFPIAVNDTPPSSSSIHSGGGGIDVGTPLTDPSTSNFEEEMKSSGNFFSLFPPLEQQQPQLQLQQLQTSLPPSLPPATSSAVGVDAVLASLSGPAPFLMSSLNAFDQQQQQQQQFDLFFQQHQQMQQQHQQQQIDFSSTTFQSYREDMALISPTTTHPLLLPPQPVLSPQDELKLIIESLAASSSSSTASSSTTASIIPASIDPTTSGTDGTVPCSEWKTNLKKMVPSVDDCNIDSLCASFEAKVRCEVVQKKLLNAITAGDTLQTLEIVRVINEKMNERRMMNEMIDLGGGGGGGCAISGNCI